MENLWSATLVFLATTFVLLNYAAVSASSNSSIEMCDCDCNGTMMFNQTGDLMCDNILMCVDTSTCDKNCTETISMDGEQLRCGNKSLCTDLKPLDEICRDSSNSFVEMCECDCNGTMKLNGTGDLLCDNMLMCVNTSTCDNICSEIITMDGGKLQCGSKPLCTDPKPLDEECTMLLVDRLISEQATVDTTAGENKISTTMTLKGTTTMASTMTPEGTTSHATTTIPESTTTKTNTSTPEGTTTMASTMTPEGTTSHATTTIPESTTTKTNTSTPEGTTTMASTMTPEGTTSHATTTIPESTTTKTNTSTPEGTTTMASTMTPEGTTSHATTTIPESTKTMASTMTPGGTTTMASTMTPGGTETMASTLTPEGTTAKASTMTPRDTTTIASTMTPEGTTAKASTVTPEGTTAKASTMTPEGTTAKASTVTPEGTTVMTGTTTPPVIQPAADESLSVDVTALTVENVASAFENVSKEIPGTVLQELPDSLLSDSAALEEIKLGTAEMNRLATTTFNLKAADVLDNIAVNTTDCKLHAIMCETFSESWIKQRTQEELQCIASHDSCNLDQLSLDAYGGRLGALITGQLSDLNDGEIRSLLTEFCCLLYGLPYSVWEAIANAYSGDSLDDAFLAAIGCSCDITYSEARTRFLKEKSDYYTIAPAELAGQLSKISADEVYAFDTEAFSGLDKTDSFELLSALTNVEDASEGGEEGPDDDLLTSSKPEQPSPLVLALRENIKGYLANATSLELMALIQNEAMPLSDLRIVKPNLLCYLLNTDTTLTGFMDTILVRETLDICAVADQWGVLGYPLDVDSYASFVKVFKVTEISTIMGSPDNIEKICEQSDELTDQQIEGLAAQVITYLASNANALKDNIEKYSCILSKLTEKIDSFTDVSTKQEFCYYLACVDALEMSSSQMTTLLNKCLTSAIAPSLLKMCCPSKPFSNTIISAITRSQVAFYPNDQNVIDAFSCLENKVASCDTRSYLYDRVTTGNLALSPSTDIYDLALIGSVCDQMTDFSTLPDSGVCTVAEAVFSSFKSQFSIYQYKLDQGLPTGSMDCLPFTNAKINCMKSYLNKCNSVQATRKRRRRRNTDVTCSDLRWFGLFSSDIYLPSELATLSYTEMSDCLDHLAFTDGFSSEQFASMATKVVMESYWGSPETWSQTTTASLGGLISGLSVNMLAKLNISSAEVLSAIGSTGEWTDATKIVAVYKQFASDYPGIDNNASKVAATQLIQMGPIVCGMTDSDIKQLDPEAYCEAAYYLGFLRNCEEHQLKAFVPHAKYCFGSNVADWSIPVFRTINIVIGGLNEEDIQKLTQAQIEALSPGLIPNLPPSTIAGFTSEQLGHLSVKQASQLSAAQFSVLADEDKKSLYNSIASSGEDYTLVFSNPSDTGGDNNDDNNNDSGAGLIEATLAVTMISLLTACLINM